MANKKRRKITQKKEYKKEKALMLMAFSYLLQLKNQAKLEIKASECYGKYDIIALRIYKWLENLRPTFATKKIMDYVAKCMDIRVYKKYYNGNEPREDIFNVGLLYFYIFLEFLKHSEVKFFIPPVTSDEVVELLDWYNEDSEIDKEAMIFAYRAGMAIAPDKASILKLKSALGRLYGGIDFEEIVNTQSETKEKSDA